MGKPNAISSRDIDHSNFGIDAYRAKHQAYYESAKMLEDEANKYMGGFRVHEAQEWRKARRMKHTPDEDGFTTVVPKLYSKNAVTSQMPQKTSLDDYYKKQDESGKKRANVSSDVFGAFAQTKKNMQRLVKMKKMLQKATSRKKAGAATASLRNFADKC